MAGLAYWAIWRRSGWLIGTVIRWLIVDCSLSLGVVLVVKVVSERLEAW